MKNKFPKKALFVVIIAVGLVIGGLLISQKPIYEYKRTGDVEDINLNKVATTTVKAGERIEKRLFLSGLDANQSILNPVSKREIIVSSDASDITTYLVVTNTTIMDEIDMMISANKWNMSSDFVKSYDIGKNHLNPVRTEGNGFVFQLDGEAEVVFVYFSGIVNEGNTLKITQRNYFLTGQNEVVVLNQQLI